MRSVILSCMILALAGCGGDDSATPTPTPTPTPTSNRAPAFTSPAAVSVIENVTAAYAARASDPDNDPVTISIAGGADAALFSINVTGDLAFRTAPNFDAPGDANGDNVYEVALSASDGRTSAQQDVRITVANDREGIAVRRVAQGFSQPIALYRSPVSSALVYVAERGGRVYRLDTTSGARTLVLTLNNLSTDGERGLIGITVGKSGGGFPQNPYALYLLWTDSAGTINLTQHPLLSDGSFWNGDSFSPLRPIFSAAHPGFSNHNGGWVDFGPGGDSLAGVLYIGLGDGGGAGDPNNNAQNQSSRLGKIMRLARDPDPYAGASIRDWLPPTVFASGLRNPFRGGFEGSTMIIGDVGQDQREEINVLPIAEGPYNLGWPYLEGTLPYKGAVPANVTLTGPKLHYGHGTGLFQGRSVIGGVVYRQSIPALNGHYLFADFVSGNLWSVPFDRLRNGPLLDGTGFENRNADFVPDVGTIDQPVAFGKDSLGNVFIVDFDGEIFQIVPAS
ncbi:glucose/arabinose dehydrogenase [Sphingobium sp. B1D7B]|uniref:PQQ-dependent sugar dehydrogenase n=1 Tax=unclassified Sphingobium TaxID=2611147 RepID=UPI0022255E1C|nr:MULTISPECIES: PQQ-dependent sugar dehydrogenase [unclassified Sphingobium]MCW2392567.1 glucose/arabinose dehydrogenase [Sphingobium sp. B11D3A]MCW2404262.1 glucose/arabinose dehydrogenase [Sphingobium sp. B1D7B]